MSREYRFHTLDVFTDRIFGGNPLAVLPDARGLSDADMTRITREFNLSETVFVLPASDPAHTARVRIFTPGREIPFAGHPTVGTAILLVATGAAPASGDDTHVILEEGVGPVPVTVRLKDGAPVSAELTTARSPEMRTGAPTVPDTAVLAEALGLHPDDVGSGVLVPTGVSCGVPYLLVPLRDRDAVSRARVDAVRLERLGQTAWTSWVYLFDGVAVARGDTIRARMFAPEIGVPEDPATGSAAAALAAYLALESGTRDGTLRWTVHQGVEMGRPSVLDLSADLHGGAVSAVRVAGSAVMVSEGTIRVP